MPPPLTLYSYRLHLLYYIPSIYAGVGFFSFLFILCLSLLCYLRRAGVTRSPVCVFTIKKLACYESQNADDNFVPSTEKLPQPPSSSNWVCGLPLPADRCPGGWRPTTSAVERMSGQSFGLLDPRLMCSGGLLVSLLPLLSLVLPLCYMCANL